METLEKIKDSDNQKIPSRFKVIERFSGNIKDLLCKSPERIEAFGRRWRLDKCETSDRVQEIIDDGKKYLKISIKPGDRKDWKRHTLTRGTERAEIQQDTLINYDEGYVQDFSFKIPEDFYLCPRRTVIWQWKRKPQITGDDAPLLSQRIRKVDGKYYLVLTDGNRDEIGEPILMEDVIGKDITLKTKIKFSDKGESVVSLVMICDGKEITIHNEGPIKISHPKEIGGGTKAYFKFGLYRDGYKHAIKKIKKDKKITPEEKKIQIKEIKDVADKERKKDSYIILKKYDIKKSEG